MLRIALKMLLGERAKYFALLFGITTTSFLVTFAASFFCGMMTRSYALIAESPSADVWVMDPAVESNDLMIDMSAAALTRVRSVPGVQFAVPSLVASADIRFPSGHFQSVEIIGVDDATLTGVPEIAGGGHAADLRLPDAALAADGGTEGKLETPTDPADNWRRDKPHLDAPHRPLKKGDEILVNDFRIEIVGRANGLPRFPPRPLLYMTISNALRILPIERRRMTFVLVTAVAGVDHRELADRISKKTGLRARSAADFKSDTVWWNIENSEDVGDAETMLTIAVIVGLGVTGVMLFLFTKDNLRYYALLKAMGASTRMLLAMIFTQAAMSGCIGVGMGLGLCVVGGMYADWAGIPFRMLWFTPVIGCAAVVLVTVVAAAISAWPVLTLEPAAVFAGR